MNNILENVWSKNKSKYNKDVLKCGQCNVTIKKLKQSLLEMRCKYQLWRSDANNVTLLRNINDDSSLNTMIMCLNMGLRQKGLLEHEDVPFTLSMLLFQHCNLVMQVDYKSGGHDYF